MKTIPTLLLSMLSFYASACAPSFAATIKVIDSETHEPVRGAKIYVEDVHFEDEVTDREGTVQFKHLPKGELKVGVERSGFKSNKEEKILVSENEAFNTFTIQVERKLEAKVIALRNWDS